MPGSPAANGARALPRRSSSATSALVSPRSRYKSARRSAGVGCVGSRSMACIRSRAACGASRSDTNHTLAASVSQWQANAGSGVLFPTFSRMVAYVFGSACPAWWADIKASSSWGFWISRLVSDSISRGSMAGADANMAKRPAAIAALNRRWVRTTFGIFPRACSQIVPIERANRPHVARIGLRALAKTRTVCSGNCRRRRFSPKPEPQIARL